VNVPCHALPRLAVLRRDDKQDCDSGRDKERETEDPDQPPAAARAGALRAAFGAIVRGSGGQVAWADRQPRPHSRSWKRNPPFEGRGAVVRVPML
jgi:hypothetical protein